MEGEDEDKKKGEGEEYDWPPLEVDDELHRLATSLRGAIFLLDSPSHALALSCPHVNSPGPLGTHVRAAGCQ